MGFGEPRNATRGTGLGERHPGNGTQRTGPGKPGEPGEPGNKTRGTGEWDLGNGTRGTGKRDSGNRGMGPREWDQGNGTQAMDNLVHKYGISLKHK